MTSLTHSKSASRDPANSWSGSDAPLQSPQENRKTNPMHTMAAGCLAGMSGTIVGYPLESMKVWMQTNTLGKNKHLGNKKGSKVPKDKAAKHGSGNKSRSCGGIMKSYKSSGARRSNSTTAIPTTMQQRATGAAARIVAKPASTIARTVRALYSGVTGPLVTVGMVQSVNFSAYDATRRFLYGRQQGQGGTFCNDQEYRTQDSLVNVAMAGSMGGMTTAVLTAPLLMMKINQQISGNGFRRAFREVFVVESGGQRTFKPLRPYGAPFLPHIVSESVGRSIYVTVYEGMKRTLVASKRGTEDDDTCFDFDSINHAHNSNPYSSLSLRERMACAALSGITCWATFFPLDVLRNRMYHLASRQPKAMLTNCPKSKVRSVLETIRVIRKERAFYRGYSITILRAGPVAAAVLPVYDLTLEWLSSSD